ncbi:hypothetical protein [Lactiplantibacillus plantarum]|uniref:hypothetical protein n=1 Tax=Lactiplantibacillus plantarum TaxID=1590 RepID=UPI001BA75360|nr:hypothetical protein [Lactiplantibacillus plantarum]MBS0935717.1 hypothetical protein [Lactiplantibacillus plantarum]MBS0943926.1 hypothetical protein [Lactiplantibacillus plantarum]
MSEIVAMTIVGVNYQQGEDLLIKGKLPFATATIEIKISKPVARELVTQVFSAFTNEVELVINMQTTSTVVTSQAGTAILQSETTQGATDSAGATIDGATSATADSGTNTANLQPVASDYDFDPATVGENTAQSVKSADSEAPALTASATEVDYRQPGEFTAGDFEDDEQSNSGQQTRVYNDQGAQTAEKATGFPM